MDIPAVILCVAGLVALLPTASRSDAFEFADPQHPPVIVLRADPSPGEELAASEIADYIGLMAAIGVEVKRGSDAPKGSIIISCSPSPELGDEGYSISIKDGRLHLTGARDRSVLYAAYDLLERLGCRWLAPGFDCYALASPFASPDGGEGEVVPRKRPVTLELDEPVVERPKLKLRKIYVEEGHSHNRENLLQMIDWMAKSRFNTLVVPTDYQGRGRVKWDNWRDGLTPELRKRDIQIEVGGHGYQNFLNAEMEDGKLFGEHPEWFGTDENGARRREHGYVFCTSNEAAVDYLTHNVVAYLKARPEIDIFDFWPPDGARWCECPECAKLGEPADRQARLVSHVIDAARAQGIKTRFECIAYSVYTEPPTSPKMPESVLIDFCPINQCFEYQINDPASERNAGYAAALQAWNQAFPGDISIYSYYRKYAWRSLPNVIPHYMQKDLRWYAKLGIAGVSTYAEPGDWRTYELNHYVLARVAWNPETDVDAIISEFADARFGTASNAAVKVYQALEDTVRYCSSIPFTSLKSPEQIDQCSKTLSAARDTFRQAAGPGPAKEALLASVDYALRDFALQRSAAEKRPAEERRKTVDELAEFVASHRDHGVFLEGRLSRGNLLKAYQASE